MLYFAYFHAYYMFYDPVISNIATKYKYKYKYIGTSVISTYYIFYNHSLFPISVNQEKLVFLVLLSILITIKQDWDCIIIKEIWTFGIWIFDWDITRIVDNFKWQKEPHFIKCSMCTQFTWS